jgi:hypothetical protein
VEEKKEGLATEAPRHREGRRKRKDLTQRAQSSEHRGHREDGKVESRQLKVKRRKRLNTENTKFGACALQASTEGTEKRGKLTVGS